jgi:hypothetical protein
MLKMPLNSVCLCLRHADLDGKANNSMNPRSRYGMSRFGDRWNTFTDTLAQLSGSTAIQCYSPATGQSLGLINPVTPDGIDRIIAKATKAQQTWAKTTFAERRQVLKSVLTYVTYLTRGYIYGTDLAGFCLTTKTPSFEQRAWTVARLESMPFSARSWSLPRSSSGPFSMARMLSRLREGQPIS